MIKVKMKGDFRNSSNETTEKVLDFENWYSISQAAKLIGHGMGKIKLLKFLKKQGMLLKSNEPRQQHINQGYFNYVAKEVADTKGKLLFWQTGTLVSMKGIKFIQKLLDKGMEQNAKKIFK